MTLLTRHLEAGWKEVELLGGKAAERFHARPGYTSSVIRVEAPTQDALHAAIDLRQSQLEGTEEPIKDTITDDGTLVTGEQHESLKTDGVTVAGAEQISEPEPNEDVAANAAPEDTTEAVETPQEPADAADQARVEADASAAPLSDEERAALLAEEERLEAAYAAQAQG